MKILKDVKTKRMIWSYSYTVEQNGEDEKIIKITQGGIQRDGFYKQLRVIGILSIKKDDLDDWDDETELAILVSEYLDYNFVIKKYNTDDISKIPKWSRGPCVYIDELLKKEKEENKGADFMKKNTFKNLEELKQQNKINAEKYCERWIRISQEQGDNRDFFKWIWTCQLINKELLNYNCIDEMIEIFTLVHSLKVESNKDYKQAQTAFYKELKGYIQGGMSYECN